MATRKKHSELISMCRSVASTSGRNSPAALPRASTPSSTSMMLRFSDLIFDDCAMNLPWWMFSMLTRRMKSVCAAW
ncbi:hypothetical protein D3C85_1299300 [compost metagenome]